MRSADEVLIERVVARDEHTEGRLLGSARTTDLLPGGGDRARVAREHDGIERADVDAELEGVRRHHDVEPSVTQVRLDRAALGRRVAAPVGAHLAIRSHLGRPPRHELSANPRPGEHERRHVLTGQVGGDRRRLPGRRAIGVRHRVPDRDGAFALGGAVTVDHVHVPARECLRVLAGIGDRRRGQDEPWTSTERGGEAEQPPEHPLRVRSEDSAVAVRLVDHDDLEVRQKPLQALSLREVFCSRRFGTQAEGRRAACLRFDPCRRRPSTPWDKREGGEQEVHKRRTSRTETRE